MKDKEFPIGYTLAGVSVIEDKELEGNKLYLDKVELVFKETNRVLILKPLADTDEIELTQEVRPDLKASSTPEWCRNFLGKKLQTMWICKNVQGYQDQVAFAFEFLKPSLAFVSGCSVLEVFHYEQIERIS